MSENVKENHVDSIVQLSCHEFVMCGRAPIAPQLDLKGGGVQQDAPPGRMHIAKFKGDRPAAISFTFDDTSRDHAEVAVPMLEGYGFRGTFFVIAGVTPETDEEAAGKKEGNVFGGIGWPQLKKMSDRGHEIGNHSWSHVPLPKLDDIKLAEEVDRAYGRITEKIGSPPLTFCYPFNQADDRCRKVVMRNHLAARDIPWSGCSYGGPDFTTEKANAWVDAGIRNGDAMVATIHGITDGYNPFTGPDVLEKHLQHVKGLEGRIWMDTFANVARYMLARDASKLTSTMSEGKATFRLECDLDPKRFDIPLTVVVPARGVSRAMARREGEETPLPIEILEDRMLIKATPSQCMIVVEWQTNSQR